MVLFGFRYMFVSLHELCKTFINRDEICLSILENLFYINFGGNCFKQKYTCKFNPGKIMLFMNYSEYMSIQGHHLYKLCKAGIPDATCQVSRSQEFWFWRRRILQVFTIYGRSDHLGLMTMTI